MGREKKKTPRGAAVGQPAKNMYKRDRFGNLHDFSRPIPRGLVVAKPRAPPRDIKHRIYLEWVENKEKKKKLEFKVCSTVWRSCVNSPPIKHMEQITTDKTPPAGFEFVPAGNPALTTACKELSREQEAMIFVVSAGRERTHQGRPLSRNNKQPADELEEWGILDLELNRVGLHIRQAIVEQARMSLGDFELAPLAADYDVPEPIPEDQELINKQADAAIRDLFPRIPNDERDIIIQRSFKLVSKPYPLYPKYR